MMLDEQRSLRHPLLQHDDIDQDGRRRGDPYFDLGEERVEA
jgi:hypothetical protein